MEYLFIIVPILFFAFWLIGFLNDRSLKKNGIEVEVMVKDIKENRDKNNYLLGKEIYVEFEYNGHKEMQLYDSPNAKIGDKITCIYDVKRNFLSRKKASKFYHICLFISIFLLIFFLAFEKLWNSLVDNNFVVNNFVKASENDQISITILIIGICFGLLIFALLLASAIYYYKKSRISNDYLKLNGVVKDILKRNKFDSDGTPREVYSPIFEFNYNGETKTYTSSIYSFPSRYKIGEQEIIYYNPKKDECIGEKQRKSVGKWGIIIIIVIVLSLLEFVFSFFK